MTRSSKTTMLFALLAAAAIALLATPNVFGTRAAQPAGDSRIATVDLLTLLEDMLQTEDFKPARDAFRTEWETRIGQLQTQLQQIETELQMGGQNNPNIMQLQQRYQQLGYQYQQVNREAAMAFDQFNAEQAAEAYATLNENASALAQGLGYTHLIVTRESADVTKNGNLATVTQEILARTVVLAPESDDLTARLRDRLSIPVAPKPQWDTPAEAGPDGGAEDNAATGEESGDADSE